MRTVSRRWAGVSAAAIALSSIVVAVPDAGAAAASTPAAMAAAAYARMSTAERVGQLFMGAVPATGSTTTARTILARYHVGNVILVGKSTAGVQATATLVAPVRRGATYENVRPFVAADQEGGLVQHLTGPGFSAMPTALHQGTLATTTLRADWHRWGGQLRAAGITLDLAPVADVVPASIGTRNQPIGRYYREYGHTTSVVSPHVVAVVNGMRDAGLAGTVKHFPGLGRATGNTDTTAGVTDPTTATDAYLAPFRAAIAAGVPAVMVSTAIYPHIAKGTIAAFSHVIVTGLLRRQLGFTGVIVSDSLTARSVSAYSYGTRAIRSLDAGVDILLVTGNSAIGPMESAIESRMHTDAAFAAVVKGAVMHVLTAKAQAGLL
ncbi:MAG: beta-N-acetylhexosaminidase [Frankiaceae bacterium]|nr:beta-N-acetylhexosaminidase [Frankiaceae bacterium]